MGTSVTVGDASTVGTLVLLHRMIKHLELAQMFYQPTGKILIEEDLHRAYKLYSFADYDLRKIEKH